MLHIACRFAYVDIAHYVLDRVGHTWGSDQLRAYVNIYDNIYNKFTPFMELARSPCGKLQDKIALANLLIEKGALLTVEDINKETVLHWAVRDSNLPMIKLLLQYIQSKPGFLTIKNTKGQTALVSYYIPQFEDYYIKYLSICIICMNIKLLILIFAYFNCINICYPGSGCE